MTDNSEKEEPKNEYLELHKEYERRFKELLDLLKDKKNLLSQDNYSKMVNKVSKTLEEIEGKIQELEDIPPPSAPLGEFDSPRKTPIPFGERLKILRKGVVILLTGNSSIDTNPSIDT